MVAGGEFSQSKIAYVAYLECRVRELVDIGGDHDLVIAGLVAGEVLKPSGLEQILSLPDLGWSYTG